MSDNKVSCLCHAVTMTTSVINQHVGACHCSICRHWGGGPFMTVKHDTPIEFTGEENISIFNSSEWAERGFCKRCGTHLFYHLKNTSEYYLPAGLFENNSAFTFDHQVFIDNKPAYYAFSNNTQDMTEAEVFALFSDNK